MLVIDATRFKTPGGSGDDVRLHQSYDLRAGRMEQVQVTDRHQAESLAHFGLRAGDLVVTDAGYPVGSSVEQTQQSQSFVLQRTAAEKIPRIAQRDGGNLESCPESGSVCRAGHGGPVTWQKRRNLERKEQQMRGTEGKPGKKAVRHHSERWSCPRREHAEAANASLRRRQTEESGQDFWDARSA